MIKFYDYPTEDTHHNGLAYVGMRIDLPVWEEIVPGINHLAEHLIFSALFNDHHQGSMPPQMVNLNMWTDEGGMLLGMTVLSEHLDGVIKTLRYRAGTAVITHEMFEREKQVVLSEIQDRYNSPWNVLYRDIRRRQTTAAMDVIGTTETVGSIEYGQLLEVAEPIMRRMADLQYETAVFDRRGSTSLPWLSSEAGEHLYSRPARGLNEWPIDQIPPLDRSKTPRHSFLTIPQLGEQQSLVLFEWQTVMLPKGNTEADLALCDARVDVFYSLADGLDSPLYKALRGGKEGLVYGVSVHLEPVSQRPRVALSCRPEVVSEVCGIVLDIASRKIDEADMRRQAERDRWEMKVRERGMSPQQKAYNSWTRWIRGAPATMRPSPDWPPRLDNNAIKCHGSRLLSDEMRYYTAAK